MPDVLLINTPITFNAKECFDEVELLPHLPLMSILSFAYNSLGCTRTLTEQDIYEYLKTNQHITWYFEKLHSKLKEESYEILSS